MYTLKGFIRYNDLINNTPGIVSPLGELSPVGLSYTKEKGYYTTPGIIDIELVSMTSNLTDVGITNKYPVPANIRDFTLAIAQWIRNNATNSVILDEVNGQYPDYLNALNTEFTQPTWAGRNITTLQIGEMVTLTLPGNVDIKIPSWVGFNCEYNEPSDPTDYSATVKLWFSDTAFRNEFDDYEIIVVPPLDDDQLDTFITGNYTTINGLMNAYTRPIQQTKITEAIDIYPPTLVKTFMFDWYDNSVNPPATVPTPWSVVIYGIAGNNMDYILEAIRDHILDNSAHDVDDWVEVFPDIFRMTEYIITPMWNRYSIPNMTLQAGLYSPMVNFNQDIDDILPTFTPYPEAHVRLHAMSGTFTYKSLSFYSVGSNLNRHNEFDFIDEFPDYAAIPTDSNDFGKMTPKTQNWVIFINSLLLIAEEMSSFSPIPLTATRVVRNGILYIASTFENVQYLVVSKKYFEDEVPPPEDL